MNETTERFLRDIAERIGSDRVTELHLFPAVRQGGVEAGLAVVAAVPVTDIADAEPLVTSSQRHVVYTARYRHHIKGGDRGQWSVEVVAEADAPLVTVDQVVRGVVRRAGEEFEPERISGDQFRAIVPAPATPVSPPA